jgi:hypothetical protein
MVGGRCNASGMPSRTLVLANTSSTTLLRPFVPSTDQCGLFGVYENVRAWKNFAAAVFVVTSVAGSIAGWKDRCDPAELQKYLEIDAATAQTEQPVEAINPASDSLPDQLETAHVSRKPMLFSQAEPRR